MMLRVSQPNRTMADLARIALLVAVGDWLTKAVAVRLVASDALLSSDRLHFAVVHNDGTAFGFSAGAYTWQLNMALTLAAIVLMLPVARDLARIDHVAPRALGLIVGGALGNLGSLILGPPGVVDFISIRIGENSGIVLNVADVAAYLGLAMMLRTGFLLVAEIRKTAQPRRTVQIQHWATLRKRAFADREVPRPVPVGDAAVQESDPFVPRPESVRRAELIDLEVAVDPKVIDIRPHLPMPEARIQRQAMPRIAEERVD